TLDEFGRAFARGSRKTAEAFVWMTRAAPRGDSTSTPGGQIYVNGKQLALYFETEAHRKVCVKPFDVVPSTTVGMEDSGVGAFNVWAIVRGGGKSGQSDAVAVAIARALSIHISPGWGDDAPEWVGSLRQMTKVDTRQVERKKTGQPKARKKYTWYGQLIVGCVVSCLFSWWCL
ncbi:ribosomal protein S9, partial [Cladochytrium replicatum]